MDIPIGASIGMRVPFWHFIFSWIHVHDYFNTNRSVHNNEITISLFHFDWIALHTYFNTDRNFFKSESTISLLHFSWIAAHTYFITNMSMQDSNKHHMFHQHLFWHVRWHHTGTENKLCKNAVRICNQRKNQIFRYLVHLTRVESAYPGYSARYARHRAIVQKQEHTKISSVWWVRKYETRSHRRTCLSLILLYDSWYIFLTSILLYKCLCIPSNQHVTRVLCRSGTT